MKKVLTVLLISVLLVSVLCVFAACGEEEAVIDSYQDIDNTIYAAGDTYNNTDAHIVANLKDGTTRHITKNLVFVGEDAESLDLEDGKFTKAGTYEVKVYALEEREDYFIGKWTIEVRE